ncbi:SRPBCC family protein [Demequina pelophila]|uniref:SRPBCC family protein n=1 Tax=Demequina pelophila TaxID=1638984 RepID=UPI0009E350D2|nr:SRPBCC family protein [Demequina pelophila]
MTDVMTYVDESVHIDATPRDVFTYCLDPHRLFAGDPKHVVESDVVDGGQGTTARLSLKTGPVEEDDALEYVDVVPDARIEIAMRPTMHLRGGHGKGHETALFSLVHTFVPDGAGTTMSLTVEVHDPPAYERMMSRLEHGGAEKLVRNRLQRVKEAVETWKSDEV